MYRTLDAEFWTDPKVRQLPPDGRYLLLYLISNPHSHVSGIYYLPRPVVLHETGLKPSRLDTLCDRVSSAGLASFDPKNEVVFVKSMFRRQAHGEKAERAAANQLPTLHNSHLVLEFMTKYPQVKSRCNAAWLDRVSHRVSSVGHLKQEQEQSKEQEEEVCSELAASGPSEPAIPAALSSLALYAADSTLCRRWAELLPAWSEAYPGVDVLVEVRKAHAWELANPRKQKKDRPRFLASWLARAQDRGPGRGDRRADAMAQALYIDAEGDE